MLKKHFFVCLLRIGHKSFKLTWSLIFRVAEQEMPLKVSKFDVQPFGETCEVAVSLVLVDIVHTDVGIHTMDFFQQNFSNSNGNWQYLS